MVPEVLAPPRERAIGAGLYKVLLSESHRRFQVIIGPRRVGKTTALYQTVRHLLQSGVDQNQILWLRLDHPLLMRYEMGALVQSFIDHRSASLDRPIFVFLDELTYAKDWDLWLKTFYDEAYPVRIAASSSSAAMLRDRHAESGIGRWDERYLPPYLYTEYLELIDGQRRDRANETLRATVEMQGGSLEAESPEHLRRYLLTGGFPELLIRSQHSTGDERSRIIESQRTLRADAVERAVYKDIPQAYGVDRPMLLERLLYVLAEQAACLLSPKNLSSDLEMTAPTIEKYIAYLERAFLVFTLQNYSGSERSKQKRGRKLYFVDGAVRNAALHRGEAPLRDSTEMGLLRENLVAGHLRVLAQMHQTRLYHWRDGNDEVDLVYDDDRAPMVFEIASKRGHHRKGLYAFLHRYPRFSGGAYLVAPEVEFVNAQKTANGIGTISIESLVRMAGSLAERHIQDELGLSDS